MLDIIKIKLKKYLSKTIILMISAFVVFAFSASSAKAATGYLKIITNTTGGDGTFDYTVSGLKPSGLSITTVNGTGSSGLIEVDPDRAYNITETIPINWKFNSASCDQSHKSSTNNVTNVTVSPGQTTTCVFSNKYPSSSRIGYLKIIKKTKGGDGIFNFTINTSAGGDGIFNFIATDTILNKSITTVNGTGSSSSISLNSGTIYSITETVPTGWTFISASCDNTYTPGINGIIDIIVSPGQTTTCIFKDTKNGTSNSGYLKILTNTTGGDGIFNFTVFPTPTITSIITVNNTGSSEIIAINPGTYDIAEKIQNGWIFDNVSCDKSHTPKTNGVTDVTVLPGQITTCTFSNIKKASLRIITNTAGGNETFAYNINNTPSIVNVSTVNGTGSSEPITVDPGTYNIDEISQDGWIFNYAICDHKHTLGTSGVTNLIVSPGQITTCNFNNIYTRPSPPPPPQPSSQLTPPSPPPPLASGNLVIIENTLGGDKKFNLNFYSSFDSTTPIASTNITTVNGTGSSGLTLAPGTYNIIYGSYDIPASYLYQSITCDQPFTTELIQGLRLKKANITILPNQTTTCTFTTYTTLQSSLSASSYRYSSLYSGGGNLIISLNTLGGDGTFDYTASGYTPSTFSITTVKGAGLFVIPNASDYRYSSTDKDFVTITVPDGWIFNYASCIPYGYKSLINGVTDVGIFHLNNTICTFNLTKNPAQGHLVIEQRGNYNGILFGGETFNYNISPTPSTLSITARDDNRYPHTSDGLVIGSNIITLDSGTDYSIVQQVPDGWNFDHASCGDGTSTDVINGLANVTILDGLLGQPTTCTFYNIRNIKLQQTTLKIINNTKGGDGIFDYTVNGITSFSSNIKTSGGTGSTGLIAVEPGATYAIYQMVPSGWKFNSAVCDDDTSTSVNVKNGVINVTINNGKTTTCTFSNTKNPSISPAKVDVKEPVQQPEPVREPPRETIQRPY